MTGRLVTNSTVASYSPETSKKYKTPEALSIWTAYRVSPKVAYEPGFPTEALMMA